MHLSQQQYFTNNQWISNAAKAFNNGHALLPPLFPFSFRIHGFSITSGFYIVAMYLLLPSIPFFAPSLPSLLPPALILSRFGCPYHPSHHFRNWFCAHQVVVNFVTAAHSARSNNWSLSLTMPLPACDVKFPDNKNSPTNMADVEMMGENSHPNNAPAAAAQDGKSSTKKTTEQIYRKKTQLERILFFSTNFCCRCLYYAAFPSLQHRRRMLQHRRLHHHDTPLCLSHLAHPTVVHTSTTESNIKWAGGSEESGVRRLHCNHRREWSQEVAL